MSRTQIAAGSVAVGVVVFLLKGLAWRITGTAALYSDALESIVNVAAATLAYGAVRFASMPADKNHPYGHDKAEFFSAVIEGVLITVAAVAILHEAWISWQHPFPIATPWRGLAVNGTATVLNLVWASVLVSAGRRFRSPALQADGRHLLTDVATSGAVFAGIVLIVLTGEVRIDPVLAALIAGHVLRQGFLLMRSSVAGLMDEMADPAMLEQVRGLVGGSAGGAIEAHDLRMRQAGKLTFLEFHLVVPGRMTVADAHDICDRVEGALRSTMEDLVVTIHVEPEGKAKHTGVVVL